MKKSILYLSIIMVLAGCQEPINIKLKSTDSKTVIEAIYSPFTKGFDVMVSKNATYFGNDSIQGISNADIIVSFDDTIVHLINYHNGIYYYPLSNKYLYKKYTINVTANGTTYTAVSTMPKSVKIDSINIKEAEGILARTGGNTKDSSKEYTINVYFKDPVGSNYYKIILFKNNVRMTDDPQSEEQIFDDSFFKSNTTIDVPLVIKCFGNESIRVELMNVDKPAYDYFLSLQTMMNSAGGSFSVPQNPTSNFNNDALGYFSAYGSDTISAIVPLPKKK